MNHAILGMKTYKGKKIVREFEEKINKWKCKLKDFLMPILKKLVIEINIPNFISLFLGNIQTKYYYVLKCQTFKLL